MLRLERNWLWLESYNMLKWSMLGHHWHKNVKTADPIKPLKQSEIEIVETFIISLNMITCQFQ